MRGSNFIYHPFAPKMIKVNSAEYKRLSKYYNINEDNSFGNLKSGYSHNLLTNRIVKTNSRSYKNSFKFIGTVVEVPESIKNEYTESDGKVAVGDDSYRQLLKKYKYDIKNNTFVVKQHRIPKPKIIDNYIISGQTEKIIDQSRMGMSVLYYHVKENNILSTAQINNGKQLSNTLMDKTKLTKFAKIIRDDENLSAEINHQLYELYPLNPFIEKDLIAIKKILSEKFKEITKNVPKNCKYLVNIVCTEVLYNHNQDLITHFMPDIRLPSERIYSIGKESIFFTKFFDHFMSNLQKNSEKTYTASNYEFLGIIAVQLNFTPIKNIIGKYIETPRNIVGDTLLNIIPDSIEDNRCLQRCLIYSLNKEIINRSKRQHLSKTYNKYFRQPDKYKFNDHSIIDFEQQFELIDNKPFHGDTITYEEIEKYFDIKLNVYQLDLLPNDDFSIDRIYPESNNIHRDLRGKEIYLCILNKPEENIMHFTVIQHIDTFRAKFIATKSANINASRIMNCDFCEFKSTSKSVISAHKFVYHSELMKDTDKYILPHEETLLTFKNTKYTMKLPVVAYCDFESCIKSDTNEHKPIMASLCAISNTPDIDSQYKIYFSENESPKEFVNMIEDLQEIRQKMIASVSNNTPMKLTEDDINDYQSTTNCPFCHKIITSDSILREYLELNKQSFDSDEPESLTCKLVDIESELMMLIEESKILDINSLNSCEIERQFKEECRDYPELYKQHYCNILHLILCKKYNIENLNDIGEKVKHHAHFDAEYSNGNSVRHYHAGEYICTCCSACNSKLKFASKSKNVQLDLVVYFHNGSRYDNTFINIALGEYCNKHNKKIEIIPTSIDKEMVIQCDGLVFKDSYRMISSPLKSMVNQLLGKDPSKYIYTKQFMRQFFENNHCEFKESYIDLLLQKEPMFYNQVNSFQDLFNDKLPARELTYDQLNQSIMSEEDYNYLQSLWNTFDILSWGEYYSMYNLLDVTLLADCFEEFRNSCINKFDLDPAHYLTCSQMSYDLFLKNISNKDTSRYPVDAAQWADYIIKISENEEFFDNITLSREELIRYYISTMTCFHNGGGIHLLQNYKGYSIVDGKEFTDKESTNLFVDFKENIRGGITQISTRYSSIENDDESIMYLDANNLYGSVMMRPMPYSICKNVDQKDIKHACNDPEGFVKSLRTFSPIGYFIICDIEVPEGLHDYFNDLPLFPEQNYGLLSEPLQEFARTNDIVTALECKTIENLLKDPAKKLICNLLPKKNYLVHYSMLQLGLKLGYRITKIHKLIPFKQSPFIFEYINGLSRERANTSSAVLKNLYKLLANSIYGKFVESGLKRIKVKVATTYEQQQQIISKHSYQLIQQAELFDEHLWFAKIYNPRHNILKPLYIGNAILDMSKYWIYKFYYQRLKTSFDNVQLLGQDTDSLIIKVKSENVSHVIAENYKYYDFSEIAKDSEMYNYLKNYYENNLTNVFDSFKDFLNYNKKVPGPFKDEHNGYKVLEFVGLRPKLYSLIDETDTIHNAGKGVPRIIDYNNKRITINSGNNMELYKQVLFPQSKNQAIVKGKYSRISNKNMGISTITQEKVCFSALDNKRYVCKDNINTLAFGHYLIPQKETVKYMEINSML